jgi:glycopeptide antibiotics resistance protein
MMEEALYYAGNFLPGAALTAAVWCVSWPFRLKRLERIGLRSPRKREVILLLFIAFCGGMAAATLTPPDFNLWDFVRFGYSGQFFSRGNVNWHVFIEIKRALAYFPLYFWGNLVLFTPFGFFPALLFRNSRWYKTIIVAIAVTAFIEGWQMLVGRTFDVDDLLLNAAGAIMGWLLWLILKRPVVTCEEQ